MQRIVIEGSGKPLARQLAEQLQQLTDSEIEIETKDDLPEVHVVEVTPAADLLELNKMMNQQFAMSISGSGSNRAGRRAKAKTSKSYTKKRKKRK